VFGPTFGPLLRSSPLTEAIERSQHSRSWRALALPDGRALKVHVPLRESLLRNRFRDSMLQLDAEAAMASALGFVAHNGCCSREVVEGLIQEGQEAVAGRDR